MNLLTEDYDYEGLDDEKVDFLEQFEAELAPLDDIDGLNRLVQDCKDLPFADYKYILFTAMQVVDPANQINEFGRVLGDAELGSIFYDDMENLRASGLTDRQNPDTVWGQIDELYAKADGVDNVTFTIGDQSVSVPWVLNYISTVAKQKRNNRTNILLYVQSSSDQATMENVLAYVNTLPDECKILLPQLRYAVRQSPDFYSAFCEALDTNPAKLPLQRD